MEKSRTAEDELDELSLIRDVCEGRHNQFELLVIRYQEMIFSMIKRQVKDEASARDLLQETFLRAFKGIKGFKSKSSFSTWLTRIALNVTNTYFTSRRFREQQRNVTIEPDHLENQNYPAENENGDSHLLFLQDCIALLKPKYRDVLVLCSLEGKTYQEAAEILEVPVGTVCSRMNSALTQLRTQFAQFKTRGTL